MFENTEPPLPPGIKLSILFPYSNASFHSEIASPRICIRKWSTLNNENILQVMLLLVLEERIIKTVVTNNMKSLKTFLHRNINEKHLQKLLIQQN